MKVITQIYNNLPANKKTQELDGVLRGFQGVLFENEREYDSFVQNLRALVTVANARYPRTTPLHVTTLGNNVSARLEGSDKSLGVHFVEVTDLYKNKAGWNGKE